MTRTPKIVLALSLTVALHAVLIFYALTPRVSPLAEPAPEQVAIALPSTPLTPEVVVKVLAEKPVATPTVADSQLPLDVGWTTQPIAVIEKQAVQPVEKPLDAVTEKLKPLPAVKPTEKIIEKIVEKPVLMAKPATKPVEKVAAKPTEKPLSKAAQKAAEKAAALKATQAAEAARKAALLAAKTPPKPAAAAKPSAVAAKPPAAASTAVIAADSSYANRVRQHLAKFAGALPPGANGEARVQFVVQLDGRVSEVHLVKFSGNNALDAVALNLPNQAQPLPLPGPVAQRLEVPVQAIATAP